MLDIRFIREHAQQVQEAANLKGISISIAELLEVDLLRRQALQHVEQLRTERNKYTQEIAAKAKNSVTGIKQLKDHVRKINDQIKEAEAQLHITAEKYQYLMERVPNLMSADTPHGETDQDNIEMKRVGERPHFDFEGKDHVELGEMHGLIDLARGVKVAGSRNYFIKGLGFQLQRAVQQLALDLLARKGFTLMDVPVMAKEEMMYNSGFFPAGKDQTYVLEKDDKYLVGTGEVPLISYYSGEVLDLEQPVLLAAVSNCFRREAGSAGRDVHGLYRVHQFTKVEQVVICKADHDVANQMLEEITANAEEILQLLELPYRVIAVCSGDMGQKNYKQYDIETWMPSRNAYGETHSSSSLLDFQARRSNIRFRDEHGQLQYGYTLNNTAIASPRILIPLIENHQRIDGSIYIPKALRPYMQGLDAIRLKTE